MLNSSAERVIARACTKGTIGIFSAYIAAAFSVR
jgi:hypothetical protein